MIRLVVLLGNPGAKYRKTRHNVAWMLADHLGWEDGDWQQKHRGLISERTIGNRRCRVLKPSTYMNSSGESVAAVSRYFDVSVESLVVVHDDVELEFGDVVYKKGGGVAGHNGLRSIAHYLKTREFSRLRIGIGRPTRQSVSSYVLGVFDNNERQELSRVLDRAYQELESSIAA